MVSAAYAQVPPPTVIYNLVPVRYIPNYGITNENRLIYLIYCTFSGKFMTLINGHRTTCPTQAKNKIKNDCNYQGITNPCKCILKPI